MKRKGSSPKRPTKKQRVDTQDLINRLQDEEDDLVTEATFNDSKIAVEFAHEDARLAIKREFKTLNISKVATAKKLAFEQKIEYEKGLHTDRMRQINEEFTKKKAELDKRRCEREATQNVDEKIEECCDIAAQECSDATWQEIGKFKCVTKRLETQEMSSEQRARYKQVLEELSTKGWKIPRTTQIYKCEE